MFKEKIKEIGKEKNNKKKIENIIFLIIVLIITIIIINTILGKSDNTSEEKNEEDNTYKTLAQVNKNESSTDDLKKRIRKYFKYNKRSRRSKCIYKLCGK